MEIEVDADLNISDEESSVALVRRSSKSTSLVNFGENASNGTVKQKSEISRDSVAVLDEKPLEENGSDRAVMLKTEKDYRLSTIMIRDVGVTEKNVRNAEERMDGEGLEGAKVKVKKGSELTKLGETVNSKSINEGSNRNSPSSSMGPSNSSEVMAMPFDLPHSKAALETSVYFVEEEGSESTELLEKGGASLDYGSEKTESGSTVTVRNGDLTITKEEEKAGNEECKQHQHGNSVSESDKQNSSNSALNEQDERQLKEQWTRILERLERSEFEGKVEEIVKILKEQKSHDLVCPVCSSYITERVILRKRKRTYVASDGRWDKEATDDVQPIVSEGEHDITEIQNDQAEISNEDCEDIEAYGCLACFSLFFRRVAGVKLFATKSDSAKSQTGSGSLSGQYPSKVHQESAQFIDRDKESFHCLPFLYDWGKSSNKASSSGATDDFTTGTSQVQHVEGTEHIGKSSGSTMIHDEVKATTVDVVGPNDGKTSIKYGKFESQLNLGAVYSKNHVEVQEIASTRTSESASSSAITIQTITFEASSNKYKNQMDTTPMKNIIAEANTSTEATNGAVSMKGKSDIPPSVKEDSESGLQSDELHFMPEVQLVQPPFDVSGSLDDEMRQDVGKNKVLNESAPVKQWEQQPLYQQDVKVTEDQLTELHFNEEEKQLKPAQFGRRESVNPQEMPPGEIDASMKEDGIGPHLGLQDKVLNNSSTALGGGELPTPETERESLKEKAALRQGDSKDKMCGCIPVSIPAVWSIWSTKKSPTDELKEPLLANVGAKILDEEVPEASKDDSEEVISAQKSGIDGSSCLETRDPASLAQSKVDDYFSPSSEISQNSGKKVLSSHAAVETVIVVEGTSEPQSSNSAIVASEFGTSISQAQVSSITTEWDLLKSIVYGGLTVSITSLGVVSSTAGGNANTLTVIAIGLAHSVSGLFLILHNILDLDHYHQEQFIETVGHSFWFNGFVAIFSYLVFGSLAPVTYGFSFQKSDDKLYKFLGASVVSLVSITLLAIGKARVTKKSYIRVTILYIVTGFWASIIGFFAGEYIKKLLEKWGFVTD